MAAPFFVIFTITTQLNATTVHHFFSTTLYFSLKMPPHLIQAVTRQSMFGVPTILWRTGLFARFCMVSKGVTAKQAAFWLRTVFPDMVGAARTMETANGFHEYSKASHNFFNALSAQCLLRVIKGRRSWETEFAPVAASKVEVLERLLALPSALTLRKH